MTSYDFFNYRVSLLSSLRNFNEVFKSSVTFYIVYQSEIDFLSSEDFSGVSNVVVKNVDWLSVSKARNTGLDYAIYNNFNKVVFHDVSLFYPVKICEFYLNNLNAQLLKACFSFGIRSKTINLNVVKRKPTKLNDYYVWLYMFETRLISHRFDEECGPGKFTKYKSGEDFLFLAEFFHENKNIEFEELSSPYIFHPPRPSDYSKQLTYASGQGRMYKKLLKNFFSFRYFYWCFLFFINAIFRVFSFKPNAKKIFKLRVKGFFSKD